MAENELVPQNGPPAEIDRGYRALSGSYGVDVSVARAVAEVQAGMMIAQRFPRNLTAVTVQIRTHCQRKSFAKASSYSYKRGNELVTGPTVRVAEMLAREMGHFYWGFDEVETRREESVIRAWARDCQTNAFQSRTFTVKHVRYTREGLKRLVDPRDIYEMIANMAQRRVRACLLTLIPADIVEMAVEECRDTLASTASTEPLIDRVRAMAAAFADEAQVSTAMLEQYLGHGLDATTERELSALRGIYTGIRDGQTTREDFFDLAAGSVEPAASGEPEPAAATRTEGLKRRLRRKAAPAPEPEPPAASTENSAAPPSPGAAGGKGQASPPAGLFADDEDTGGAAPSILELRTDIMNLKSRALKAGVSFDKVTFTRLKSPVSACADANLLASLLEELRTACADAEAAAKSPSPS